MAVVVQQILPVRVQFVSSGRDLFVHSQVTTQAIFN
jgi:hypothetical protein